MRLRNTSMDDLVRLEPHTNYKGEQSGFKIRHGESPFGVTTMNATGAEMIAQAARLFEIWRPVMEAWMEHFADVECPHGVRFDDEIWGWHTNDYCFDLLTEPERAIFILSGYHEEHLDDGQWFCLPAWFDAFVGAFTWDMQPSWYEASRGLQLGYLPKWVREAMP